MYLKNQKLLKPNEKTQDPYLIEIFADYNTVLTASGVWKPNEEMQCYKLIKAIVAGKKVAFISNAALTVSDKTYKDFIKNNLLALTPSVSELVLNGKNAKDILNAEVVYIAGGYISQLLEASLLKDLKENLKSFYNNGGMVVGESAGSIIFGPNAEWYYDVKKGTKPRYNVKPANVKGMSLCNLYIYPHANSMKPEDKPKCELVEKTHGIKITYLNDGDFIKLKLGE